MIPIMRNRGYVISAFDLENVKTQDYVAPQEDIPTSKPTYTPPVLIEDRVSLTTEIDQKSMFGTLVFSDLKLQDPDSDLAIYMDTVLFDVSHPKNIVKTSIQGRAGTVKEYISDGDYSISIKGAIVNSIGTAYPEHDVKSLIELLQLPVALIATSPYLQLFNIYSLVVDDYSFPQRAGFENTQFIQLSCSSDEPIELVLNA